MYDNKIYIVKFIRDDDVELEFDAKNILLNEENTLLTRPDPDTSEVNFTETNGGVMVRQRNPIFTQDINGLIVPKTRSYREIYMEIAAFWKINHTYKIVYITTDGDMFSVDRAWISSGLQIPPRPHSDYAEWTISLNIGTDQWHEYDPGGYAHELTLPIVTAGNGGETWDTVGLVADDIGEDWDDGRGGAQDVVFDSTDIVYPVWEVKGPCQRPTLQNNTTNTFATFELNVAEGQTLVVNFETGVAMLDDALVSRYLSGVVSCKPGVNTMGFNSDGGAQDECTLKWNNIVA